MGKPISIVSSVRMLDLCSEQLRSIAESFKIFHLLSENE